MQESGAQSPAALEREFGEAADGSKRSWERYVSGLHSPSIIRANKPGIVQRVALRYPRTFEVFTGQLWTAMRPDLLFEARETTAMLLQLTADVSREFVLMDASGVPIRNWTHIRHGIWEFPAAHLAMDYLAAYLLLLREAQLLLDKSVARTAEHWIAAALGGLNQCLVLAPIAAELDEFIRREFLA